MSNTAALAAIAGHYANHPDLPSWHSIDVDSDGVVRVHIAAYDRPSAGALIEWASTLNQPTVRLRRFIVGWAGQTTDQVDVHGHINGQQVVIHHGVAEFGNFIGAPTVTTVGTTVDIPVDLDSLRAFHDEARDDTFGVAA